MKISQKLGSTSQRALGFFFEKQSLKHHTKIPQKKGQWENELLKDVFP